ncbi:hypothetical protein CY34DRAFT_139969 [Suillus luteus UH-Slu-Lm8-n1]|uniref:Uncharacterized protein n=1 Tax=Suillus luteus UH-Slu-Lm8-n1 TaxID=930992 RepID=A0A0D0BHA0_9AGAM|nr:hypothetical protein CY34DRAFT_139969 [Suillus luteus UH-Slu-Lm8-n1]
MSVPDAEAIMSKSYLVVTTSHCRHRGRMSDLEENFDLPRCTSMTHLSAYWGKNMTCGFCGKVLRRHKTTLSMFLPSRYRQVDGVRVMP